MDKNESIESQWDLMKIARKLVKVLAKGLTFGLGEQKPGAMCVEAAVCYAMGLPHGDDPPCVHSWVRNDKIGLNDEDWSSNRTRAEGLREVAIAQLGSNTINNKKYQVEHAKAMRRRFKDIVAKEDKDTRRGFREYLQKGTTGGALRSLIEAVQERGATEIEIDQLLAIDAQCMVDALRACKSPGVAILDQLKAEGVVPPSQFDTEKVA
jgi:hypothetical protein